MLHRDSKPSSGDSDLPGMLRDTELCKLLQASASWALCKLRLEYYCPRHFMIKSSDSLSSYYYSHGFVKCNYAGWLIKHFFFTRSDTNGTHTSCFSCCSFAGQSQDPSWISIHCQPSPPPTSVVWTHRVSVDLIWTPLLQCLQCPTLYIFCKGLATPPLCPSSSSLLKVHVKTSSEGCGKYRISGPTRAYWSQSCILIPSQGIMGSLKFEQH